MMPICKKSQMEDPGNYNSQPNLSACGGDMEQIILSAITQHVQDNQRNSASSRTRPVSISLHLALVRPRL